MDTITLTQTSTQRRRYSPEFKAQIVATCKRPGTSVAAIARLHNINDNIVHRWISEAKLDVPELGSVVLAPASTNLSAVAAPDTAPFVPVQVNANPQERIHLELTKNGLSMRVDWPASQSQSCLQTLLMLLR